MILLYVWDWNCIVTLLPNLTEYSSSQGYLGSTGQIDTSAGILQRQSLLRSPSQQLILHSRDSYRGHRDNFNSYQCAFFFIFNNFIFCSNEKTTLAFTFLWLFIIWPSASPIPVTTLHMRKHDKHTLILSQYLDHKYLHKRKVSYLSFDSTSS